MGFRKHSRWIVDEHLTFPSQALFGDPGHDFTKDSGEFWATEALRGSASLVVGRLDCLKITEALRVCKKGP